MAAASQILDENALVEAVAAWLEREGFTVQQALTTKQKGVDIVAKRGLEIWLIEAKGGTSSFDGSVRHGRPFKKSQVLNRVAKAFYTSAATIPQKPNGTARVFMAFPDHPTFRAVVQALDVALKTLNISVLWVSADGPVNISV